MGDRANIFILEQYPQPNQPEQGVYLYTHWGGTELATVVHRCLSRRERWDDSAYLARLMFREMGAGGEGETGYGIAARICDNSHLIIRLDCNEQNISLQTESGEGLETWTFENFVKSPSALFHRYSEGDS